MRSRACGARFGVVWLWACTSNAQDLFDLFDDDLTDGFVAGMEGFDWNADGVLQQAEVAVGILSAAEDPAHQKPWQGSSHYELGRMQCEDPWPCSVSLNECLIAEARSGPKTGISFPASYVDVVEWFAMLCDVPSWRSGECLDKCSVCRDGEPNEARDDMEIISSRSLLSPRSGGINVLLTSDWHIDPWYNYDHKNCGHHGNTCHWSGRKISNMFECGVDNHHPKTCRLNGGQDPPIEFGIAHLQSRQALSASVAFFGGDTQVHGFDKAFDGDFATGVKTITERVIDDVLRHFDADNVVWGVGNNDAEHYGAFKKMSGPTEAWADSLLSRKIVTNDLRITYSGAHTSHRPVSETQGLNASRSMSQTDMFKRVGFYCKKVPKIDDLAYAIVMNTILGGSNSVQQAALDETLAWIYSKHGSNALIYIMGHQPSIMSKGTDFVSSKYRSMVKGVLAGHVHKSVTTSSKLFTQMPGVTQNSEGAGEFWVALGISRSSPEIRVSKSSDLVIYKDDKGKTIDSSRWSGGHPDAPPSPGPGPSPRPTPTPPPRPTPTPPPRPTPTPSPSAGDTLTVGDQLHGGDHLVSSNGNVRLEMQTDGNLVIYHGSKGADKAVWSSQSGGKSGSRLAFQDDGNLVMYDQNGRAGWNSGRHSGATKAVIQNDCALVTTDNSGRELWSLGTKCSSEIIV